MHYHLEVIIPPTQDIDKAVAEVLKPYCEEQNGAYFEEGWWDWYEIGGRWSGEKRVDSYDKDQIAAFEAALKERKVTVSGVMAGKPKLEPESQIPMVDALWQKYFPNTVEQCPFFAHSVNDAVDVCTYDECPKDLSAYRVIIATPDLLEPNWATAHMEVHEHWDGTNTKYVQTDWDGTIEQAIERSPVKPEDNWFVITVDYHC